jgi:membrane protein YqaA with SNARE-associated domain
MEARPEDEGPPMTRGEVLMSVAHLLFALGLFAGTVTLASLAFKDELARAGSAFVARFGAAGMAIGAFLADGVHFPLPPQFYLFAGIASGEGGTWALASVVAGSVAGGFAAFSFARFATRARFFRERADGARRLPSGLLTRHGYWGLALATLLPVGYWVLCSLAGLMRLPRRAYVVLAIMRVPRLLLSYPTRSSPWRGMPRDRVHFTSP